MKKIKSDNDQQRQNLYFEKTFWRQGFDWVIGVDEAGRGPLAGPVVAGAFSFFCRSPQTKNFLYLLSQANDSKKISSSKRFELYQIITGSKIFLSASAAVGPKIIDQINIFAAAKLAMRRAAKKVICSIYKNDSKAKIHLIIDGNFSIGGNFSQTSVITGDHKVFSVACASIIAKTARDKIMARYNKIYQGWNFIQHKGYPTAQHRAAICKIGLSPIHRRSFSFNFHLNPSTKP